MINSRAAMMITGTTQNTPVDTSVNIAPRMSTLSASGSRNAPDRGDPVAAGDAAVDAVAEQRRYQSTNAIHEPRSSFGITQNINGDSSSRPTVTAFAQVAIWLDSTISESPDRAVTRRPARQIESGGHEIGPERVDDLTSAKLPHGDIRRRRGRSPSISGASRCVRPTPGASTSTDTVVPIERVATVGRDVVLQLAQLGEALVHQLRIDGAVEVGGIRAVFAAVAEETAPVELRLLDEIEQLVVVGLGLARDSRR